MLIKKPKTKEEARTLYIKLSWKILEHKFRYYEGHKYGLTPISDDKYDKLESVYKKLAKLLKEPTSASDMVGFDYNRPSCKIVVEAFGKQIK